MPTGTAPDRLTLSTLGPAATIVVSCRIGSTVDMFHSRGSTALITSLMFLVPPSAASIFDWMLWSQMPVMFDGACTSAPGSGVRLAVVGVVLLAVGAGAGLDVGDVSDAGAGGGADVDTAVASSAGQPYREASSVARFPPAWRHPTMASTRLSISASRYSTTGSRPSTVAAMPTLRNWSAAVLATATAVGSFDATPMTRDSWFPSLLIRPRVTSGGPVVAGAAPSGGVTAGEVSFSIWYPAACSSPSAVAWLIAGGAVGT